VARVFRFAPVLPLLVAGCQSLGNNYETRTLTDTQGHDGNPNASMDEISLAQL